METAVEFPRAPDAGESALHLRLLGPLAVRRNGLALPLPASRKVRGLLAYLAVAPRAVSRERLCELLWDLPNDPRGELRWCLSKLRGLLDAPGRRRVQSRDDGIALDLQGCEVDALDVLRATDAGLDALPPQRQHALAAQFAGDFVEGLEIRRSPGFDAWLTAQRRRFRGCHAALLERLARHACGDAAIAVLEKWLQLAPFDRAVHEAMLDALARQGRFREAEEHLAAAARRFEADGLEAAPLHRAWRTVRTRACTPVLRAAGGGSPPIDPADREVAPVTALRPAAPTPACDGRALPDRDHAHRASLAVMPFDDDAAAPGRRGGVGDAIVHDVITRLAKLRSVFVIAQGTVFALHERHVGPEAAGRMLDVRYVVGGTVRRRGDRLHVDVDLSETRSARIVWAEAFDAGVGDAFAVLDGIGDRIVASVASEIEANERNRAVLKPPESLDAWEAHHRGLWHMYRFSRDDNAQAAHWFERAVRLDPTFARAHAGLSFTHFQNAFQGWAERRAETARALDAAARSLMIDERDPAAHWAMGRALWLRGDHDGSVGALAESIALSPNFALGHYALAFVHSQGGDPAAAIAAADHSRRLSPCDPLLFGMLGARAMALARLGRFDEAAAWAAKAAARPNAHPHIYAIAALSLALAGDADASRTHVDAILRKVPGYGIDDFLSAFRFDALGAAVFREGARRARLA